jgi:hypothetical protein
MNKAINSVILIQLKVIYNLKINLICINQIKKYQQIVALLIVKQSSSSFKEKIK